MLSKMSGLSHETCALLLKVCTKVCDGYKSKEGNRQSNETRCLAREKLIFEHRESHSRAAVYCDCGTTSNVSVTTWARHPVEPPTMRMFNASVLGAKDISYSV